MVGYVVARVEGGLGREGVGVALFVPVVVQGGFKEIGLLGSDLG
jgi:hypothetical protein